MIFRRGDVKKARKEKMDLGFYLKERVIRGETLDFAQVLELYNFGLENPYLIASYSHKIQLHFKGKRFQLCMIVNAKSGMCPEDCKFCAQSVHHSCEIEVYPFIGRKEILKRGLEAKREGATFFSIVTSGPTPEERDWPEILGAVRDLKGLGLRVCASLGMIDIERLKELKEAGLFRYHHNLETSRENFKNICTTHTFEERLKTIRMVKRAGISTCSGGIIGMGESPEDRISLAFELKEMDVDSVPINILNPRPGTPLEGQKPLSPKEIIVTISVFRYILPDKDIRLCAGKEIHLRQLIPLAILAGCNGLMTGNYLTTRGRNPSLDRELVEDLGFELDNAES